MHPHGHVVWSSVSGPSRRRSSCACTPTAPHILWVLAACSPSPGPSTVQLHEAIVSVRLACMPVVRPKRPKSGELPHLSAASNDATNRAAPSTTSHAAPSTICSRALAASAVFVLGFGCKGKGKVANYGVAIAPPNVAKEEDIPWSSAAQLFFIGSRGRAQLQAFPCWPVVDAWLAEVTKPLQTRKKCLVLQGEFCTGKTEFVRVFFHLG